MPSIKFKIFGQPADTFIAITIRCLQFVFVFCLLGIGGNLLSEFMWYNIPFIFPVGSAGLTLIYLITTVASSNLYDTLICTILEVLYLGLWTTATAFAFRDYSYRQCLHFKSNKLCQQVICRTAFCLVMDILFFITITLRFIFSGGGQTALNRGAIFPHPYGYETGYNAGVVKVYGQQYPATQQYPQFPQYPQYPQQQSYSAQQPYLPGQYPQNQQAYPPVQSPGPHSQQPYPPIQSPDSQALPPHQQQTPIPEHSQGNLPKDEISSTDQSSPSQHVVVNRESTLQYPPNSPLPNASIV